MTRGARRCVVGTGDLDGMVERGELTTADADAVRTFAEWLSKAGPPGGPLTEEQRAFRLDAFRDAGWREYLGITEAEARVAVERAGAPWDVTDAT